MTIPTMSRRGKKMISERSLELAVEVVVERIMDQGEWKNADGEVLFDLYDWLFRERDHTYALEIYVLAMSRKAGLTARVMRERRLVESVLLKHLKSAEWVVNLAIEFDERVLR